MYSPRGATHVAPQWPGFSRLFRVWSASRGHRRRIRRGKGRINKHIPVHQGILGPGRVSQIDKRPSQDFASTPLLKGPMHGFEIGVTLRKPVPLGTGRENPQHGLQNRAGRKEFTAPPEVRELFFGEVRTNRVSRASVRGGINAVIRT